MRFALPLVMTAALALAADAHAFPQSTNPAMTDPSKATETAPESFRAKFETTKGDVVFECTRSWAPHGVDRFYNLVKIGFFDDVALFRVAKGFVVQWGIHGDPKVATAWADANLPPDPVKESNKRGTLTYAMAGSPDTRSTQLFINYADNSRLDSQGFGAICKVVEGMSVADAFNGEYGERVTGMQGQIQSKGNAYLREAWPNLDYIKTATIVGGGGSSANAAANGDAKKDEEAGGGALPYVLGGLAVAIALVYFLNRKPKEAPKAPEPKAKAKAKDEEATDTKADSEPKKKKKKRPEAE